MSTEPTGANGTLKHLKRINMTLSKKDWCSYEGECLEHLNINGNLCLHCKYKKNFDIPKMLNKVIKANGNNNV